MKHRYKKSISNLQQTETIGQQGSLPSSRDENNFGRSCFASMRHFSIHIWKGSVYMVTFFVQEHNGKCAINLRDRLISALTNDFVTSTCALYTKLL